MYPLSPFPTRVYQGTLDGIRRAMPGAGMAPGCLKEAWDMRHHHDDDVTQDPAPAGGAAGEARHADEDPMPSGREERERAVAEGERTVQRSDEALAGGGDGAGSQRDRSGDKPA